MDGGFDFGGFPPADQGTNGFPQKKKKKKSKKGDPFGFDDGGESAPEERPPSSRRVSFSDEAMGRPIEEFAAGFGGNSPGAASFPGGTSGPSMGGYSSPSSAGRYPEASSYVGTPLDRFEDSVFSRGGRDESLGGSAGLPSAIDQALSRAAESRSFADSLTEPSRPPQAAGAPVAQSGLGPAPLGFGAGGQQRFGEDFGGPRRVQRGFSFSLNDMPDGAVVSGESPYFMGAHPPTRDHLSQPMKWNPLDGISRHWAETEREAMEAPVIGAAGKSAGGSGAFPSSLLKPGTLEEELAVAEQRVKSLHSRLFELESGATSSAPSAQGHLKITVPRPLDTGKLGVAVKDMTVVSVVDTRAVQFGWCIGDRILQVNGFPVCYMQEFANELNKALAANLASGRPLIFDIWRQGPSAGPAQPVATAAPPATLAPSAAVAPVVSAAPPSTLPLSAHTRPSPVAVVAGAAATSAPRASTPPTRSKWRSVCGEGAGSHPEHRGAAKDQGAKTPPLARPVEGSVVPLALAAPATMPPSTMVAPVPGIAVPLALPAPASPVLGLPRTLAPSEYAQPLSATGAIVGDTNSTPLPASRVLAAQAGLGLSATVTGSGTAWATHAHAAELAPTMRMPATAPVQGSSYPMGFTKDTTLPSTMTTLPMPGSAVTNGSHDPAAATAHPHHAAAAVSRRRHLVC